MKLKVISTGSKGNAYILENENEALLIECGVNINLIKQQLDFNISKLSGCIVTHEHIDHSKAINDVMALGVNVYASSGTFKGFGLKRDYSRKKIIKSKTPFKVGGFKILPFDVEHDALEPLGFLIEHENIGKMLFLTDTYYCKYNFKNLDHILIECNYIDEVMGQRLNDLSFLKDRIIKSHMSLTQCIKTIKQNNLDNVKNILLIHLSDTNSNEAQMVKEVTRHTGLPTIAANNETILNLNKNIFE